MLMVECKGLTLLWLISCSRIPTPHVPFYCRDVIASTFSAGFQLQEIPKQLTFGFASMSKSLENLYVYFFAKLRQIMSNFQFCVAFSRCLR